MKHARNSKKKIALITIGIIVALLAVIYGIGAFVFSSHFYPGTVMGKEDVSMKSTEEVAASIDERSAGYTLKIEGQGFSFAPTTEQVGLAIKGKQVAKDAISQQNPFLWFVEVFGTYDRSEVMTAEFASEGLGSTIKGLVDEYNKDKTPSENARIVYDEKAGKCVVKPEVYGNQIDVKRLMDKVALCVSSLNPVCEVTEDEFTKPTVLASDERIDSALEEANKIAGGEISLTMNGKVKAGTITKGDIANWLVFGDDLKPVVDEKAVSAYVDKLSDSLNTTGSSRTWKRADGKTCTVSGGSWGWKVDTSKLSETICSRLSSASFEAIDIPCSKTASAYDGKGKRDWGAYVDIDISQQHVRYYDANDKLLYETNCVTGNAGKHDTPTGVYSMDWKQSPRVLKGTNDDGSSYESKVSYWMPFIDSRGIGLHDASWRSSFGGSIYRGGGSHGCVNLPTSSAAWLYKNLPKGICVVVHK